MSNPPDTPPNAFQEFLANHQNYAGDLDAFTAAKNAWDDALLLVTRVLLDEVTSIPTLPLARLHCKISALHSWKTPTNQPQ